MSTFICNIYVDIKVIKALSAYGFIYRCNNVKSKIKIMHSRRATLYLRTCTYLGLTCHYYLYQLFYYL